MMSHKEFYLKDGRYCSTGGFGRYVELFSRLFEQLILVVPVDRQRAPAEVTVFDTGTARIAELPAFKHRFLALSLLKFYLLVGPMWRAIRQADVVHIMFPGYSQLVGLVLSKLLGKPLFCTFVGDWEANFDVGHVGRRYPRLAAAVKALHRPVLRWIVRSGPTLVFGRGLANRYRRWSDNVLEFGSSTFTERDLRPVESVGMVHAPPRLLYVGRLDYKKGVAVLLQALAKLRDQGLRAQLDIAGSGPDREEFERLARELDLSREVSFLGFIKMGPELWRIYGEHDILVLPSFTEGIPKAIIEAFANGLAVVATRVGGIPDLVGPENGLLVPPHDVESLAQALGELLRDADRCSRLARNNVREARNYTMEARVGFLRRHLCVRMPKVFTRA